MKKAIRNLIIIGSSVLVLATALGIAIPVAYYIGDKNAKEEYNRKVFEMYYETKLSQYRKENETLHDVDISFVGDSLTDGYDLETYYPSLNVVNRGIGGDTTTGVLKRMKESIYDVKPKITSLLIGANNMDHMFDDYEDILKGMKENMPNMKVVLCSLTSMSKEWGRKNELAKANNERILSLANSYGYTYVDLFNPLLDVNTNELKEEYTTDGGHFTPLGYEKVTSVLMPVYQSLL